LLLTGAGSLANAVLSTLVVPLDTLVPMPVKSAGLPISKMAAVAATTIHSVPSMVRVARLRIRPCQASHIAPRMTTGARYGK
jgi:ABC-type proline/glycine betaine transport system permease subunit